MRAVSLHGVTVAWDARDLPSDPLAWLGVFPPGTGAPDLTIRLARRASSAPPRRGAPWFFHGVLQASREPGVTLLDDGSSRAEVRATDVLVELALVDAELGAFASGLVGAAVLLALREHELFDLHAAAVVDAAGRGLLVAGDSGAGKTTTTLALLEAGAAYVGDDRVLLRGDDAEVEVLGWPREFHLGAATLRAFPRLGAVAGETYGAGDKVTLDPRIAFPQQFLTALPSVDVLVFPSIDASRVTTTATPIDRASAFGELLVAGAIALLDGMTGGEAQLALLRRLADDGVALALAIGRDALADPSVIPRAIAEGYAFAGARR